MRKTLKLAICMIAIVLGCSVLVSCSSDDAGDTSAVTGTWTADDYDHFYSNVTLTFRSDGTGSGTLDHYGTLTSIHRLEFKYKVKGNKVTAEGKRASGNSGGDGSTSDFKGVYEIQGNKLIVTGGDSWYKGNVSSYRKN